MCCRPILNYQSRSKRPRLSVREPNEAGSCQAKQETAVVEQGSNPSQTRAPSINVKRNLESNPMVGLYTLQLLSGTLYS